MFSMVFFGGPDVVDTLHLGQVLQTELHLAHQQYFG